MNAQALIGTAQWLVANDKGLILYRCASRNRATRRGEDSAAMETA